jgi:quercetin dioxygenase-like cupin family protein
MIISKGDMKLEQREEMRGGTGAVSILHLADGDKLSGARLFSEVSLEKGCSIGSHTHTGETEYYYILSGKGTVAEDGGIKQVLPGDLVVTGNGESHSIRNSGEETLRFIALILLDQTKS